MTNIGEIEFNRTGLFSFITKIASNIYIYTGLFIFALSVFFWLIVLSKVEVSVAYPFVGVGCIFTVLMGNIFLGEPLTLTKIAGVLIVCVGIFLISK